MTTDPRKLALALMADGEQIDAQIQEIMRGAPDGDLIDLWDRSRELGGAADCNSDAKDLMIYSLAEAMIRQEFQRRVNVEAGIEMEGT